MTETTLLLTALLTATTLSAQDTKGVHPVNQSTNQPVNRTRAVVVGISDYQDAGITDLRFADRDALAFANFLRSPAGGSMDNDHLQVLTNSKATMANLAAALDWLLDASKEGDEAIIYFSGHGDVERKTISQPGYLLCWDAPARVYLAGGALALPMFQDVISTLSVQNKVKVMVITDACRSGKLSGSTINGAQATAANLAKQFGNEVKILSCQPDQYSIEGEQWGGGRGVFSFHLVDALYGMADANADGSVNLLEIGRYLEDRVTAEASPMAQLPMVSGNKTEPLFKVFPDLLAQIRKGKAGQMPVFAQTESRGLEEEVLATVDSATRQDYLLFKTALGEKRFFAEAQKVGSVQNAADLNPAAKVGEVQNLADLDANAADPLFEKLLAEPKLARLHPAMRRNYAAALQNDAQQAMNIWLKADIQEQACIGKTLKLEPIPRQLARAADILGEGHYMYKSLKGRQLYFEGYVLQQSGGWHADSAKARQILGLYQKSLAFEPGSAVVFNEMTFLYGALRQLDSAEICAKTAQSLAPNWVSPYVSFYYTLAQFEGKTGTARQKAALDRAIAVDSLHGFVLNAEINWLVATERFGEALAIYEKYAAIGGATWPCWYAELANIVGKAGTENEQEKTLRVMEKQVAEDSTSAEKWLNLADLYYGLGQVEKAVNPTKKSLSLDSTKAANWGALGLFELLNGRADEAEKALKKGLSIDSTDLYVIEVLAAAYNFSGHFSEAEALLNRGLAISPYAANILLQMGLLHFQRGNTAEAVKWYQKVFAINPNQWEALQYMASVAFREGKTDEAFEWLEKAFKNRAEFAFMQFDPNLAPLRALPQWKVLVKKYRPGLVKERALWMLEEALARDPSDYDANMNLAGFLFETRQNARAESLYSDIIARFPAKVEGYVHHRLGRYEEAERRYRREIQIAPNSPSLYSDLGWICILQGRWEEALALVQKAIELAPQAADFYADLAVIQAHLPGKMAEAEASMKKATTMATGHTYMIPLRQAQLGLLKNEPEEQVWANLEKAMEKGYPFYLDLLATRDFDRLRQSPRWAELMKKYFPDKEKD